MVPRRFLLRSLGLAATAALTGCSEISWPSDRSTPDDGRRTPTATPNATLAPPPTDSQSEPASTTPTSAATGEPTSTVTEVRERQAFTPTSSGDESSFGTAVTLSDDVALVDVDGERVHAFEAGSDGWQQTAVLTPGDEDRFAFYPTSMTLAGTTAYVGAPATDHRGAVDVFERDGGDWRRRRRIPPDDDESDDFGAAVACDGETLVVGAVRQPSTMMEYSGTVSVFEGSGTDWTRQTSFESDPDEREDLFGRRVALSGDTVLVGAPATAVDGEPWAGKVYGYERSPDGWTSTEELVAPDGEADDEFGRTLALDGDTAVVGAPGDDGAGTAYVFERSGGEWSERARVSELGRFDHDDGPFDVALRGDTVLVGDPDGSGSGRVRRLDRTDDGWTRTAALVPDDPDPSDEFGTAVAIAGSEALVGAPSEREDRRGRGYLFSL